MLVPRSGEKRDEGMLTDTRTGQGRWRRHRRAIDIVVSSSRRVFIHKLRFVEALLRDFIIVYANTARRSAASVDAFEKGIRVVDFEVGPLCLNVTEELKLWTGRRDAGVAVEDRASQRVEQEGPAILAATAPFVTRGAASTGKLWGSGRLESLLGIAAAGSGGVGG